MASKFQEIAFLWKFIVVYSFTEPISQFKNHKKLHHVNCLSPVKNHKYHWIAIQNNHICIEFTKPNDAFDTKNAIPATASQKLQVKLKKECKRNYWQIYSRCFFKISITIVKYFNLNDFHPRFQFVLFQFQFIYSIYRCIEFCYFYLKTCTHVKFS